MGSTILYKHCNVMTGTHGNIIHTASVHENVTIIGGSFGFDLPNDVIAYKELPEEMKDV